MDEVFLDPSVQMQLAQMFLKTPQMNDTKGTVGPSNALSLPGVMQNQGPQGMANVQTVQQQQNAAPQEPMIQRQEGMPTNQTY